MPWIGESDAVMEFLAEAGADKGDDGRFIISGEAVTSGIGGVEIIVPDGTVYFVNRRPLNLAAAMKGSGEGFGGFKVFDRGPGYRANPAPDAEAAIRQFLDESGDELAGDRETAQFFPEPGGLIVRVKHPGYMSTLLLGGHGTTTDDNMIGVLRVMLQQAGYRPTWSQRKGGGKWRSFKFRPTENRNPRLPAQGWRLEHATYLAQNVAGVLVEGVRDELVSAEPLTPPAAVDLFLAYGYMYQAHFIALALGATPLAAQIGDAMEGIAVALGAGCGAGSNRGAHGRPKPAVPNPDVVVLDPEVMANAASAAIADLKKSEDERRSFSERFPAMLTGMGSVTLAAAAAHDHGDLQLRGQMEDVKDKLIQVLGQGCATENLRRIEAGSAGSFSRRWGGPGGKKKKKKKSRPNPEPDRHRRSYSAYIQSAGHHLDRGAELMEKGQRLPAFKALRHAECDIRQAYTEAFYAKKDDADLEEMTAPLESIYQGVQGQMRELETRL